METIHGLDGPVPFVKLPRISSQMEEESSDKDADDFEVLDGKYR